MECINKMRYFTILFIPFALQLASCSYPIIGTGQLKLVDRSCQPIQNKPIQINNITSSKYLNSGHLATDVYTTDRYGLIEFYIEKSADKLVIFIPDAKGKKNSNMNWYWTVSNNDEVYFRFLADRSHENDFKTELIKSSAGKPIIIVYPHQKNTCGNQNHALDKYNWQKNFEPKQNPKKIVKLPKFSILGYGIINIYLDDKLMNYDIVEINHIIKKQDQKTGLIFGLLVSLSEEPMVDKPSDIYCVLHYPKQGLTNPNTGETITKDIKCIFKFDEVWMLSTKFKEPWYIQPGEWRFQLKYKDTVLLEKSFFIE